MAIIIKKEIKKWTDDIRKNLVVILMQTAVSKLKEIILEDYDFNLNNVANPKSNLAPENYLDEFSNRLDNFEYIDPEFKGFKFITPDMHNFDFSGELETIESILEGIVGRYVEVKYEDYVKATNKKTYRGEHKEVYLIKYDRSVRDWEKDLDKKFEDYAFSNTPPIDIFGRANEFVEENMDGWVIEAINKFKKRVKS